MTDRAFEDVHEVAEYAEAAAAAAARLIPKLDAPAAPIALTRLFANKPRPVVVIVARDAAAHFLLDFIAAETEKRSGRHDVERVEHERPDPDLGRN